MGTNELVGCLIEIFGRENVVTDKELAAEYTKDLCPRNFIFGDRGRSCLAVVRINEILVEKLAILVSLAKKYGKKIVVRGGGSGVCGAVVPREPEKTIIIDMTGLDTVYEINTTWGFISAGAGIKGDVLETAAQECGYTIGHSPASLTISTLGGWLATRSSGQFSARYGTIEELVLEIEAVTADGKTKIFTGQEMNSFLRMEGTTGIITRAKVRIFPVSKHKEYVAVSFRSLQNALNFVGATIRLRSKLERKRVWLSALRLYDFVDYRLVTKPYKEDANDEEYKPVSGVEKTILLWPWLVNSVFAILGKLHLLKNVVLIVLESDSDQEVVKAGEAVLGMANTFNGRPENFEIAKTWYDHRFKLNHKKLVRMLEEGFIVDTLDCRPCDPDPGRALELYRAIKRTSGRSVLTGAHFGIDREEIYIYFTFIGYVAGQIFRERTFTELWLGLLRTCFTHKAFSTHHHGIGMLKSGPSNLFSPHAYGEHWFWRVAVPAKEKLDPNNIFNPGNVF